MRNFFLSILGILFVIWYAIGAFWFHRKFMEWWMKWTDKLFIKLDRWLNRK